MIINRIVTAYISFEAGDNIAEGNECVYVQDGDAVYRVPASIRRINPGAVYEAHHVDGSHEALRNLRWSEYRPARPVLSGD